MKRLLPVLVFALTLSLIQLASGARLTLLPVITVAVFLLTITLVRLVRWSEWIFGAPPGSRRYTALLFALSVRHFAEILAGETRRVLVARRLALPRRWGPGAGRSLVYAVAALFEASLARAERFYAAQSLRGLLR